MSIHDRYKNARYLEKFGIFRGTEGASSCKIIGRKQGNLKWQLIKLESLLHNKVTASQFFVNLIFSKPSLTSTRDNTEFNKCHSQIEAAQNCVRK